MSTPSHEKRLRGTFPRYKMAWRDPTSCEHVENTRTFPLTLSHYLMQFKAHAHLAGAKPAKPDTSSATRTARNATDV